MSILLGRSEPVDVDSVCRNTVSENERKVKREEPQRKKQYDPSRSWTPWGSPWALPPWRSRSTPGTESTRTPSSSWSTGGTTGSSVSPGSSSTRWTFKPHRQGLVEVDSINVYLWVLLVTVFLRIYNTTRVRILKISRNLDIPKSFLHIYISKIFIVIIYTIDFWFGFF